MALSFAGGVHCLKDKQQRHPIICVERSLQFAQVLNVIVQRFLIPALGLAQRFGARRPVFEVNLLAFWNPEPFRFDFHLL